MISIIVPIYNAEKSLSRCIDSLLEQTYRDIQILLINDGSSDGSGSICEKYAERDSRIKYIVQRNGGVASARNKGIAEAAGEYIAFVDSDDCVLPNIYEMLFEAMKDTQSDLVICGYTKVAENEKRDICFGNNRISGKTAIAEYVAKHYNEGVISSPWNKLFKKKFIIRDFPLGISLGEDLLFNVRYFNNIESVNIINAPLYLYYQFNENSLTSSYKERYFDDMCLICNETKEYLFANGLSEDSCTQVNYKLVYYTLHFMLKDVQHNKKKYALKRIKNYCMNQSLYLSSHNIGSMYGYLMNICCWLIRKKRYRLLYIVCRIRMLKKRKDWSRKRK